MRILREGSCYVTLLSPQLRLPMPEARRQPGVRDERTLARAERRRRPGDPQSPLGEDQDGVPRPVRNKKSTPRRC